MRFTWLYRSWLLLSLASCAAGASQRIVPQGQDGTAIQHAIDAAQPGDSIALPAGVYPLTAPIRLKSQVRLVGIQAATTQPLSAPAAVLRFAGTTRFAMIEIHGCDGVELADLTLDGAGDPKADQGIVANESRRLLLHRLAIHDFVKNEGFGPHAVYFSADVTDSAIEDCTIERIGLGAAFGSGIRMSARSSRNRVAHNTIHDTGRGGVFGSDGSTDLQIIANTVSGSHGEGLGIEVWHACDRAVIEDNHIDHWLSVDGSACTAVRRNTIGDPADTGPAKLAGLEFVNTTDCVFTDNLIDGGQNVGISESGKLPKSRAYFAYDKITRCPGWGMQLQGEEGGIDRQYFYRCEFSNMLAGHGPYPHDDGYGIRFNGNVHDLTFEECDITQNARLGIQLGGENVDRLEFLRCRILNNGGAAVSDSGKHQSILFSDCAAHQNANDTLPPFQQFTTQGIKNVSMNAFSTFTAGESGNFIAEPQLLGATQPAPDFLWDFGDGPATTGRTCTHTYNNPGPYRVTLIVWDANGRSARAEKTITVTPQ